MSALLDRVIALSCPEGRAAAAAALGRLLGGDDVIVFVRDPAVGALLPAPGFPQTLRDGRAWRGALEACLAGGACALGTLPGPGGGAAVAAYGVACGPDVVAVVLGTDRPAPELTELRGLLPLLAAAFQAERATTSARAELQLAGQAALHASAMASALDAVRGQLQRALAMAETARLELETANAHLQDQASELEMQTEEMQAQAEELQRTNSELETARRAADAANRAKSDFLATMSHELRTPLNAIGGHVQLIQLGIHGPVTDAQRDALERVDRSQRHLLGLINEVLNLARIESGRVEYHIDSVRLMDALCDMQSMIEPQVRAKRLHYETRCTDPSPTVRADAEKLQQILLNLLSNAVKFTGAGGAIVVECARNATSKVGLVRVTDTGIGIPKDRLDDIFEPFVQVDASHRREGEGTGLGLAISRDLARGMGGDLTVESEPAAGSTFTLSLPLDR